MKKLLLSALMMITISSCSTSKTTTENTTEIATDPTYGFSEKNPIYVGGVNNGPINEREFLSSLTGPNGEKVTFKRLGSCCEFKSKNSPFGMALLDMYAVSYEGKKDTVTLYLNMYDKGKLKTPIGFRIK